MSIFGELVVSKVEKVVIISSMEVVCFGNVSVSTVVSECITFVEPIERDNILLVVDSPFR